MSKRMYHPCHKLSVPSAKLFWCRHCMQMFEDAISRWKHSRKCHAIPGYKQKDQDARVVQLYVKPDKVSYTSNITPGQAVYHKPHVKKTSTDLKCVICGTKFSSLYDMRKHVKEPCQKSDNNILCDEIEFQEREEDLSYSSLKIRRVETEEEEEKLNTNTALSVLAEASKHVESLSQAGEVILEQVVEEVPQIIQDISQSAGNSCKEEISSSLTWYPISSSSQQAEQEVVVAYPRPQVRPELGAVVIALQSEDGKQIAKDSIDLETIQDCVKETALTLPVGQIIHIQFEGSQKYLQFVVGYQGIIWPVEEKCSISSSDEQEKTENALLSRKVQPALPVAHTVANSDQESFRTLDCGSKPELVSQPVADGNQLFSQEIVVTSEETVLQGGGAHCSGQILLAGENNREVLKEQIVETPQVQFVAPSPGQRLEQNLFQVSLVENQAALRSNNQIRQASVVAAIPVGQAVNFRELQTQIQQQSTESLVEALLKGSVIISPPAVKQEEIETVVTQDQGDIAVTNDQTEVAVVEITDQHVGNLAEVEYQHLQSYPHHQGQYVGSIFTCSQSAKKDRMASGELLVDDLFGFAELTGENVATTCKTTVVSQVADKKAEVAPKFHLEKEQIKRDTDEVIVPILFEKSGVKKYKVLARHQVEDDEDIRRPGSSERSSPNSEEQRKENINIKHSFDNVQNKKLDVKKNVKRQKVKGIENTVGEHSLKKLKKKQHAGKWIGKINKTRGKVKKDKRVENEDKKVTDKDPGAVSYAFQDDLDVHLKQHDVKSSFEEISQNEDRLKAGESNAVGEQNSFELRSSEEKVKQKPLKIECLVKLRRDPSIENFYKTLSDSECALSNSFDSGTNDTSPKKENLGSVIKNECNKCLDFDENKTATPQNIADENRLKMTEMIYNADIQVRKSGRLQSAKCASRYRGDYGIRKDTYKQLVNKTINTSSEKTDNKPDVRSNCKASDVEPLRKSNCQEQLDNEESSKIETRLSGDESEILENRLTVPTEAYNNVSSDTFTVLRDPDVVSSMAENMPSKTEACSSSCISVDKELLNYTDCVKGPFMESKEGMKEGTCIFVGYSIHNEQSEECVEKCENERKEVVYTGNEGTKTMMTVNQNHVNRQNADLSTEVNNEKSGIQKCCETCDNFRNSTVNEFTVVPNEVPSQVIKEIESCIPLLLTEKSNVKNEKKIDIIDQVVNQEVNQDTSIFTPMRTEVQADIKSISSIESEDSKEKNNETLTELLKKSNNINKERSGYVHSVGKSVNKIQKRMEIKKPLSCNMKGSSYPDISPESSPVKDTAKILESLRQKLFESAGADVVEADKVPKQFESKLISSKQRQSTDAKLPLMVDVEEKHFRESDSSSGRSGKSTPKCSTPKTEPSTVILEEVAKSLGVLHKAKRKNDGKQKPSKRQRFEEKKFLLRSMKETTDDQEIESKGNDTEVEQSVDASSVAGKIHERRRSSRNSAENSSYFGSVNSKSSVDTSDVRQTVVKPGILEKTVAKPKPVKCSACSHIFKTKELLRKHFPCRIRQTRTWSQNKLRPNRAVKRVENSSKKFVCKLPKPAKSEASLSRPQLLTYRKTKFRKVKGKRRRRLYQLIQDLKQKRMPVKWPHLSIVYDDLSFKEQCLYKLGLICVGNASEGLERYTAEDITVFEQHRAKERWMTEDAQTFEHSIPNSLGILSDVNVSTEISTDNQESDFCSPKSVINFPQVNIDDISCDNGSTTEENLEGASNEEKFEIASCLNDTLEISDSFYSNSSTTKETKEREISWCLSYMHEFVEKEDCSYEEIVELEEIPEMIKANISIQDYASIVRNSDIKDIDNVTSRLNVVTDVKTIPRCQTIKQLQTWTKVRESSVQVETVEEISSINKTALSVEIDMEKNFLHKAVATETDVCSAKTDYVHDENSVGSSVVISNQDNEKLHKQELSKPGFVMRRELISSSHSSLSSGNEQAVDKMFDDSSEICHDNKFKLHSSGLKHNFQQQTFPNASSIENKEKPVAKETGSNKLEGSKRIPSDTERKTSGIKTKEHMKNVPVKKALLPAPDIELFHQTATIDEKYLASNILTIPETVAEKDIDNIESCLPEEVVETGDETSMKAEIHQNIIRQASEMLEDILEDVEQTVSSTESKCMPSTTVTRFKIVSASSDDSFLKRLDVNTSPVKGILKSPKKEFTPLSASSPIMSPDRKDSAKENSLKSPAKKKIDFKTYAKRKGMIKDKDDKDKECMRSESHEIEDGLLNRLLDAVNVIDSIIEEHKDHIEPEGDTFSAITPEMAFEAAMIRNKTENADEEESSKLYDIESVYTSSEFGNMDVIETTSTTCKHMSEQNENRVLKDTNIRGSSGNTGISSDEIDPHLNEKAIITNINNTDIEGGIQEDFENNIIKGTEVFDSSFARSLTLSIDVTNPKPFMNRNQQSEQEAAENFESETVINSTGKKEILSEDIIESDLDKIKEASKISSDEMEPKPNDVLNLLKDAEPVEKGESNGKKDESLSVNDIISSSENVNLAKINDDKGMKSPEFIAKGVTDSSSSAIKESKRDFTIKYEMNGIVVKENLLTGDKNVVENSSPFRSSAESENNFDQSSQSDVDISVVENNCFYSDTNDVDMKNTSAVSSKANADQIRKNEEYDVLPCDVTTVLDQNLECYKETDLSCSLELIDEVNLENGIETSTEIETSTNDSTITKEGDTESVECIDIKSTAQLSKEIETTVLKDFVEDNCKLASCVEIEPLPLACVKLSRNIFDDHSVGSPPVLEKVDTENSGIEELNEHFSCQDLNASSKVEPPILEPQHLKENEHDIEEQNELKITQKTRTERHFLDVLGIIDNKMEDINIPRFDRKKEPRSLVNDTSDRNTILKKICNDETNQDDAIGRHFSDVVNENVDAPKTPKSKLQFLLDKSEKGEVTLAQIKDILTPFSKKGKEILIPNETLLKIKSGIANLLGNIKNPSTKDPSWLKRDALSDYSREKKLQRRLRYNEEEKGNGDTSCEESCSDQEEIDYSSNDILISPGEQVNSPEDIVTGVNTPSGRSVADTILQMLTSLEDKGSIADNMSNLLDILAENLGFLGKGSVDKDGYESSLDSDCELGQNGETVFASDSDSTKNMQKDLIANYLVEGDKPPSLDEIPTAGTQDVNWSNDFLSRSNTKIKENFENEDNTDSFQCSLSESGDNKCNLKTAKDCIELDITEQEPCRTFTGKEVSNEKLSEPTYSVIKKSNDADIAVDLGRRSGFEDNSDSFFSFSENCLTIDEAKDQKGKASTIFKSITELNSIETDEESNSGDSFDPVPMSVRLSELKALGKENTAWEFNSDFDSDQNDSDKFESDFENEAESLLEDDSKDDLTMQQKEDDVGNSLTNHSCCKLGRSLSVNSKDLNMFEKKKEEERLISKTRLSTENSVERKKDADADETEVCFEKNETSLVLTDKHRKIFPNSSSRIYNSDLKCEEDAQNLKSPLEMIRLELEKEYVPKEDEYPACSQVPLSSLLRPVATIEKSLPENNHSINDGSQIGLSEQKDVIHCNEKAVNVLLSETTFQENSNTQSETNNKNVYLHNKIILENDLNCTQVKPTDNSKEMQCKVECDSINGNKNIAQVEEKSKGKKYEEYNTEETNNYFFDDLGSESDTRVGEDIGLDNSNLSMLRLHSSKETTREIDAGKSDDFDLQWHRKNDSYDENINENDTHNCEKVVCADDEDTNETVAYNDELVESRTDFNGLLKHAEFREVTLADKLDDNCLQIEYDKSIPASLRKSSQESNSKIKASRSLSLDRKANDDRNMTVPVSLKDEEKYEFSCLDLQHPKLEENENNFSKEKHETKQRSASFNIDNSDFSDLFCETIAEKVKRNQRDRSKSVCYSFNPWLYYSAAYVREVTKPTKREISVFRSSILEKRAREKSDSIGNDDEVSTPRKKRNSSVPKESDISYQKSQPERCVGVKNKTVMQKQPFHTKPCTVLIPKLTEEMIERFTRRKRKNEEEPPSENRPPIKVTIKLSQIVYPPNSPYGSTSVSSDACRSGYESCSEESESEMDQQDSEINFDCRNQRSDNNDIKLSTEGSEHRNGIDNTEMDLSFREPIKIKMRTLLTKMNSCEEKDYSNSIQNTDQGEQLSVSLTESSSDTNIEGCSRELIESEVLHDIKQECEKVRSRDKDVLFYLSDSESEITPNVRKKEKSPQNKEKTKIFDLGVNIMPEASVQASYGESDVDLSDSDTDTDIQMQIDKILSSKSIEHLSQDTTEDKDITKEDENIVMNMIVSDLRLSESESESETDMLKKGRENFSRKEVLMNSFDSKFDMNNSPKECEKPYSEKSGQAKLPQTGINNKEMIRFSYPGLSKPTVETIEQSVVTDCDSEQNKDIEKSSKQNHDPVYTLGVEKEQDSSSNFFEEFDLSEISKEQRNKSSISKNEFCESSSNEDMQIYQDPVANSLNTSVKFKQLHSHGSVGKESILENGRNCDKSQAFYKSKHKSSLNERASHVDSKALVSPTVDIGFKEFEKEDQTKDILRHACPSPGVRKVVEDMCIDAEDEYEDNVSEDSLKGLTCILDVAHIQTEQMKTCKIENLDVSEHALTSEERKDIESAKAVQNLEEDTFQDFQQAHNSTSDDMIYYAVELSDDPETNEAVVNLESVELIERPIVIENTDTHEENVLDTSIVQSHVDDQIEIQSEPLNEQIVETLSDSKHNTELKINDALESITHVDSPVYCPVIDDVKSKYLYGINEDSQSSIEVVEELVTDSIVSENVVVQQNEHHVICEKVQIFSDKTILEGHSEKHPDIFNSIDNHDSNKETVATNKNTEPYVDFDVVSVDLSSSFDGCQTYDETSNPGFQMESRPCLNISDNLDTRKMCSGEERLTDLRFRELSGTCDLERTRISSDSNSFLQSYDECGMAVECNDEDDFIITQNDFFDEDNVMDTT